MGATALAAGAGVGTVSGDEHGDAEVVVTIDNVGSGAWEVTDTDGEEVAPTGEENPTLTLTVGTRYAFENNGWDAHPLAFRDDADEPLLSQAGTDEDDDDEDDGDSGPSYSLTPLAAGEYADDADVDWVDDGDRVAFTLTEDLAGELDNYVCTIHGAMVGDIETETPTDEPQDDGAPGFGIVAALAGVGGLAYLLTDSARSE